MTEGQLLEVAREAAEAAAAELLSRYEDRSRTRRDGSRQGKGERGSNRARSKSTPTDLVSDADLAAEAAIRRVLQQRRPDDAILAEESGASAGGELRWLVDPLDGTVNYLFGIPAFAVSIACEDRSGTLVGLVLDPIRRERFEATRSGPATLDGEPLRLEEPDRPLALAMVATGFAYDARTRGRQAEDLTRVLPRVRDIRRVGAAALDLTWTACGRFDAYYERGLHAWDVAAGSLIAARAGLSVRTLAARGSDPGGVIVARPGVIDELQALVEWR